MTTQHTVNTSELDIADTQQPYHKSTQHINIVTTVNTTHQHRYNRAEQSTASLLNQIRYIQHRSEQDFTNYQHLARLWYVSGFEYKLCNVAVYEKKMVLPFNRMPRDCYQSDHEFITCLLSFGSLSSRNAKKDNISS